MAWPSHHVLLMLAGGLAAVMLGGLIFTLWLCFGREDDDFWAAVDRDQSPMTTTNPPRHESRVASIARPPEGSRPPYCETAGAPEPAGGPSRTGVPEVEAID